MAQGMGTQAGLGVTLDTHCAQLVPPPKAELAHSTGNSTFGSVMLIAVT